MAAFNFQISGLVRLVGNALSVLNVGPESQRPLEGPKTAWHHLVNVKEQAVSGHQCLGELYYSGPTWECSPEGSTGTESRMPPPTSQKNELLERQKDV